MEKRPLKRKLPRVRMMWGSWRQLHEPASTDEAPLRAPSAGGVLVGAVFLAALAGTCAVVAIRGRDSLLGVGHVEVTPVVTSGAPAPRPPSAAPAPPRASAVPAPASAAAPAPVAPASAPPPSAPPPSAPPPPAPPPLPKDRGDLLVTSRADALVYVNGVLIGPVNQPGQAPCGLRFVRLARGDSNPKKPTWMMPGQSVAIACQRETTVNMDP